MILLNGGHRVDLGSGGGVYAEGIMSKYLVVMFASFGFAFGLCSWRHFWRASTFVECLICVAFVGICSSYSGILIIGLKPELIISS